MRLFVVAFCVMIGSALAAHAETVEGTAYLSGNYSPEGIMVIFTQASPSARTDTAITNRFGMFDLFLQPGWYNITYRRNAYADFVYGLLYLHDDIKLPGVTLMMPLQGRLNGTIGPGDFHVTDSLYVQAGETATLAPGTHLYFGRVLPFCVAGTLIAVGTPQDSILFSRYYSTGYQATWRGLSLIGATNETQLQYVIIEHATKASYYHGGAVYGINTNCTLANSTFRYNHADDGGGLYFEHCAPRIEDCAIIENVSNGGAGMGISYASATVKNCLFQGNSAYYSGGGLYVEGDSSATVEGCQFVGNDGWDGGGLAVLASPVKIKKCLFVGNAASRAASMLFNDATGAVVSRCTLTGNYGTGSTAFSSVSIYGGAPEITTTLISESSVRYGILFSVAYASVVHYCDINVSSGTPIGFSANDSSQGPQHIGLLDTLNARGDTCDVYQNIFLDPEFSDSLAYHLEEWSPCIDTGDPYLIPDSDGSVADMGAFPYEPEMDAADPRDLQPTSFTLANYPNPFNATTSIAFDLPRAGQTKLTIFDVSGRRVQTILSAWQDAGQHTVHFDASHLASGVYFYHLTSGEISQTRKMMLLK
jgi:predicted outer membrane repeat protein